MKNRTKLDAIKILESLNICKRCVLRFLGERSYSKYSTKKRVVEAFNELIEDEGESSSALSDELAESPETSVPEDVTSSPAAKRHHPTPCATCLGLLQDCESMADVVESAVKSSGYHFTDFVLQLSLPVVADFRQRLMYLYLSEQLGSDVLPSEDSVPSVKEVWKWIVGSAFGKSVQADFSPQSDFQISVSALYPETAEECDELRINCPEAFPNYKRKKKTPDEVFNRTAVLKAIDMLAPKLKELFPLPPVPPLKPCIYGDVVCTHSPLYLGGRYNKYSRELSQTPWLVDGERRIESSVQELITDIVQKWIVADKIVFSASGREDVDVKMLGTGRPFVLEVLNPRRSVWSLDEIRAIENEINGNTKDIAVRDLQIVSKSDTQYLKEGEEMKRKSYSALCIVKKQLTEADLEKLKLTKDLKINQKTPLRVLHRRPLAIRPRIIHNIEGEILSDNRLKLYLETQAGTYVKEFVHSDFGRTVPSLGSILGTDADILELDVESVQLDWPPKIGE